MEVIAGLIGGIVWTCLWLTRKHFMLASKRISWAICLTDFAVSLGVAYGSKCAFRLFGWM